MDLAMVGLLWLQHKLPGRMFKKFSVYINILRSEFLTAITTEIAVLWNVVTDGLAELEFR
jgi:hypothetical protein